MNVVQVIPLPVMKCRCGCGEYRRPGNSFLPGHDLRAAMHCITEHYGNIENFINEHNYD